MLKRHLHFQNRAGIFHLQNDLQTKVFGKPHTPINESKLESLSLKHLRANQLLNMETTKPQHLQIDLPNLVASNLDEHFQKIGKFFIKDQLEKINLFINSTLQFDFKLIRKSGWTKYNPDGTHETVDFPREDVVVFDCEVLYKVHEYAVVATCVSSEARYVWLSPWLLGESLNSNHLIPLGEHEQVVVGHNIGYDRKRVKEEYTINRTSKWFLDTMSLHIAVNGMCNQQRLVYLKYETLLNNPEKQTQLKALLAASPWLKHTSMNSLKECLKFHLNLEISKDDRKFFETTNKQLIVDNLDSLVNYCMDDSVYTKQLLGKVLPKFIELNPHPVTLASLKSMASVFLPITRQWDEFVHNAEEMFKQKTSSVSNSLRQLAYEAVDLDEDKYLNDPWLKQLDWEVKPIRYTKSGTPYKNQKMPGKPQWFKDLFPKTDGEMNLTSRTRATPLLLRLKFLNRPLLWLDKEGWCFQVPTNLKQEMDAMNMRQVKTPTSDLLTYRLPHPEKDGRCTNPFAKFYMQFFESGEISSENKLANEAINSNLECSYWTSARQRLFSQMPVYQTPNNGIILPRIIPIGAVTRRAVEDTWLTASNAKQNKLGSELKSKIMAPKGYKIVGADVDSEELWIASVVADSIFKMHGSTAIGWMTLEGTKSAGTDLHSKSAKILEINRNQAKVINYGRIYGAGVDSASRNMRLFNPQISHESAKLRAEKLYAATKGVRQRSLKFPLKNYRQGGSESVMFNQLELLAHLPRQKTPVLGSGISDALKVGNLKSNTDYMTTRTNWSIQSSGVDYLHLLIMGMEYLTSVYGINARLLLTVHDEVRYLVKEEDQFRAALALQIANLWTRAMFCDRLGFDCLPYSVSFFSQVDIDHVLRKEVNDPCVTTTNSEPIPNGTSLNISELLDLCNSLGKPDTFLNNQFRSMKSEPTERVMAHLNDSPVLHEYIEAQISQTEPKTKITKTCRAAVRPPLRPVRASRRK